MRRPTLPDNDMSFAHHFDQALIASGRRIADLQRDDGISRQHISLLRNRKCFPTTATLRKLCSVFSMYGVPPRLLTPLLFSGIGFHVPQAFYEGLPYLRGQETNGSEVRNRCVVTDVLAECLYPYILDETIEAAQNGVEYFYFLPSTSREWERMLAKAASRGEGFENLLREQTYGILCPDYIINGRFRIDNLDGPEPQVYVEHGPNSAPSLQPVQDSFAQRIVLLYDTAATKARTARSANEKTFSVLTPGANVPLEFFLA